jgi:DNA-binding response OmpR family regulator
MLTGIGASLNEATSPLFGADDYIDKPFEFEKLDQKIESVLRQRATQRNAVPRPLGTHATHAPQDAPAGNGVGTPSEPAASEKLPRARRTPKGPKRRATKLQRKTVNKHKKGSDTMAAKKKAKKAKKAAKKTAKKAKRK